MEVWRTVPEFPRYEVSDLGRIRISKDALDARGTKRCAGRIRPSHPNKLGYWRICFKINGKAHNQFVHRLVMAAFVGACQKGMEVNHKNGDRSDNRLCNLEYVTRQENSDHAFSILGRTLPKGEDHWASRYTDDQVKEIVSQARGGKHQKEIARDFGCSQSLVSLYVRGVRTEGGYLKPTASEIREIKSRVSREMWARKKSDYPQPISG